MKIINTPKQDFHMHSITFSDGCATVNEIVQFAGKLGMKKIAITDHSSASDYSDREVLIHKYSYVRKHFQKRWKNVFNDVEVIFGVEGDVINEKGDFHYVIYKDYEDFIVLSLHHSTYKGDMKKVTQAYINTIERFHDKIKFIAHPCNIFSSEHLDIEKLCEIANKYKIPLEFNCSNFVNNITDLEKQKIMLEKADQIIVNSDAHSLFEMKNSLEKGWKYLKENGYI